MWSREIKISHPSYAEPITLCNFWLRDHCKCKICYDFETYQRRCSLLDIPLDISPVSTKVHSDYLHVKWNDGHESKYEVKFLFESQYSKLTENCSKNEITLWDKKQVRELSYAKVDYSKLLENESSAKQILKSLVNYGFAFIENVPTSTEGTEAAIKSIFEVQKTFFGEMWTFSDNKDHADTAYTKDYLGPHNDNTYFCDAAGLQILHCIEHSGTGGESTLTDGFKVLKDYKLTNPKGYEMLSKVSVPAEYIENGQHHKYAAPIIELDSITNEPIQIRFNVYDRAVFNTLPQEKMYEFYENFRELIGIIQAPINQYVFKLMPGTIVIFDNWRLLHGRQMYSGRRVMTGCYVSRTEYMSKARQFGLID